MTDTPLSHCSMTSYSDLPSEIWDATLNLLNAPALRNLRLSCKCFNDLATPYLFKTIRFELTKNGCDALEYRNIISRL
jgi:hypothetical protein